MYDCEPGQVRDDEQERVKNVDVALDILEYLASRDKQLGVREAARLLDVPKSTVQRIFNSLAAKGVVRLDESTRQYALDYGILKLCHGFLGGNDLSAAAGPVLRDLRDATDASVCLNVRVGVQTLTVLQFESRQPLRWSMRIGVPYPLNAGAGGKLLAAYSGLSVDELRKGFDPDFGTSRANFDTFVNQLEPIRTQGYAISRGEMNPGVTALSVPVFDQQEVVAGIGLYQLDSRMTDAVIKECLQKMQEAARRIELLLAK
ncbi:MAG: IclR family transcriptional regulator [Alicyclobacillus macrosporangiidus]|uniref:IclR family transcriptional regulator n=1 Tax=Alicyclobacillus macrosporangiidus TaxID=392015 RepID=UPI0026EBD4CD|nr:IclR family transcriptional regulator [Alicyclobacillus macrosporangiidus]MCL6599481.1 IclR family transcriptional regulator [Alicyclobacillus macrosporangiidus]